IIEEPIAEEIITEEPIIDESAVEGVTEDSQSINELPTEEQDTDININIPEESSSVDESLLDNEIEDLLSELNGDIIPDSDEIISDTTEVSDVPELNDIQVSEEVNNEEPALDYEISDLLSELNGDIMDPSDISDLHGNSEISSDIGFEDSDVSTDLNMNENEPSDVIPDGIQIGDFSDFQDSETGEAMEENADNGSAEWDPVQTAATSSDGELSQEELAAMLNDIGAFDINSMPAEEPVNVNTGDNGTPSALDMLDNLGESDEDLLNLLENLDPQSVNEESNNEINDLLSGERQETKEEKKARKKQEKLQKKEAKKNAKKKTKNSDDQTAVDVDADVFPDTEMINSNDLNDVAADIPDDDNMAVADILQSVSQEDNTSENDSAPDIDGDPELDSLRDISDDGSKKGKKNKKKKDKGDKAPGFWSKFINMLFAEPEEEEEQEVSNEDIIAEIDAENAEALLSEGKGKPKKAKKKKDKAKGGDNPQGEENPDNIEVPPAKKEKKKKEKPAKEKVQKPKEPKVIVLSKPAKICLITLCITVIAVIIILSSVLPERNDIKAARSAYFKKDYETVYRNLYSVNRNSSDEILFRRAENYLLIKRRWDSYKSRYSIGEKVEALDSLIEGLVVYRDRIEKIDADILDDCNTIYSNIIDTLQNVYGLTPDDAYNLYGLEKTDYTNALYTIVFGEKYVPVTIATDEGSDTSAVDSNNNDNQITEGQDSNNEAGNDSAENNNAEDKPGTAEEVSQPSEDIALDDMLPGEGDY
ncbi:MAG: hypothetical protein MJ133_10620, partial [Lachnospiraceae bacterium]|nr:hypothetical protein [Lachnospiraceae bacterium]